MTLRVGADNPAGTIEVLTGFHHYYELAGYYFRPLHLPQDPGPYPVPYLDRLPEFITWLQTYIYSDQTKPPHLAELLSRIPPTYQPVAWEVPVTRAGELFCFDSRLPHRNIRNRSETDRIVAYVSLFRHRDWVIRGAPALLPLFLGERGGHAGSNRDNVEERLLFYDCWDQRVRFQLTPLVKRVLAFSQV